MNELDMMHGRDWQGESLAGWLASEKLNGCRAYWDGSALWTRGGNAIDAPAWFTVGLPAAVHIDGEVWAGRGRFEEARLAVQFGRFMPAIRFAVFDAPQAPGNWSSRMRAASAATLHAPRAFAVEFWTVESRAALLHDLAKIQQDGGEGIVCRRPECGYSPGRCSDVLKVK